MNDKVLITGGAGFIGSNLALSLLKKGYSVRILDNLSPQIHGENPEKTSFLYNSIKDKCEFILGSVCDREIVKKALMNVKYIIHLAAETGTGQSMYEVYKYTNSNITGTAVILDTLVNTNNHSVEKMIVASSRSIYGEGRYLDTETGLYVYPKHRSVDDMLKGDFEVKYPGVKNLKLVPTDEESKIHPSSVYGITKQNQEQMIMTVCPTIGIAPVAFRYQNVYGPGQSLTNPYTGILSIFSTLIKNNKSIAIFEDGKESRDFVYIDDVITATILGLESEAANSEIFNVGSGESIDVLTVANILITNYKTNVPTQITGNFRIGDIRHNYADLSKIKRILKFTPKNTFEEGINKFAKWVNEQSIYDSNYEHSIVEMKNKGLFK